MSLVFATTPTDFYKYVKRVIDWNSTALGGVHDFSDAKIQYQRDRLVREEFTELHQAIEEKNKVEFVDALADLVVTIGYWLYLKNPRGIDKSCKLMNYCLGADHLKNLGYAIDADEPYLALQCTMALFYETDCVVDNVMQEVLDSNDSKFHSLAKLYDLADGQEWDHTDTDFFKKECQRIENRSKGRYTGVTHTFYGDYIVYRDGTGKIMKPTSFQPAVLGGFV